MDQAKPSRTKKQRLARLETLIGEVERESARLAKIKDRPERARRKLAWSMALVFSEGARLKQTETLGRAYLALKPLVPYIGPGIDDFFKLSDKARGYLKCRKSCIRRFKNQTLRDACISYCILLATLCVTPDQSPN